MVFFNAIYQTYSQEHSQILKIGLVLYSAILLGIYSPYVPESLLDSQISQVVKKYGWILIIIDYVVLLLLHYLQTGKYLFTESPPVVDPMSSKYRTRYQAWHPNLEQSNETTADGIPVVRPTAPGRFSDIVCDEAGVCQVKQKPAIIYSELPPEPKEDAGGVHAAGELAGGVHAAGEHAAATAPKDAEKSTRAPFDLDYALEDESESETSVGNQEFFTESAEPKVIDTYALNNDQNVPQSLDDLSETISE